MGRFIMTAYERREQNPDATAHTSDTGGTQQTITQFFEWVEPHQTYLPSRGIGLMLQHAGARRVRCRPRMVGYGRPRLHQEDISRIRIAHGHMMEQGHITTTWNALLQDVLSSPPMYHILHPPQPIYSS
ncbi:hypothetical protein KP509_1Z323200 [Ceratopteris richardii]|nr:hypothetical protein KP509_1Z323200 [Ceratopteris richardii]